MLMIIKDLKGDQLDIDGNGRGITLLDVTMKGLARIATQRIMAHITAIGWIGERQFCERGRGTEDAIMLLWRILEMYAARRRAVSVAFVEVLRHVDPHMALAAAAATWRAGGRGGHAGGDARGAVDPMRVWRALCGPNNPDAFH